MKPYSSYKPSNIPWLAPIPTHWETKRAKRLFHKMERPPQHNDKVVTCFRDGAVTLRENRRTEGFTESLQEIGYQGIREGDLVVHNMDAFAGAIGVSDSDGKGTPVYSVCTMTPDANAHYYAATIREMARSQWITALATGIRERSTDFRYATLAQQILPVPPLDEQAAIVRYLGRADDLISRYISVKERLIATLEEQRQAVIHKAIVRGINPDVQLQDTQVDWLGKIPARWQVQRLKVTVENIAEQIETREHGDIYIALENVRSWTGEYDDAGPETTFVSTVKRFKPNDVLFGKLRPYLAKVARPRHKGVCVGEFLVLRPKCADMHPRYLELLLLTKPVINKINSSTFGAKMPRADWRSIGNMVQPLPPLNEQVQIADHLDSITSTIHATIKQTLRQIDLMNEYRTRLIADVVTGQLDVRNVAVELPN